MTILRLSARNTLGIGDAENDHAFMRACGCAAAVANALPTLKDKADRVLAKDHGAGVVELIDQIERGAYRHGGSGAVKGE